MPRINAQPTAKQYCAAWRVWKKMNSIVNKCDLLSKHEGGERLRQRRRTWGQEASAHLCPSSNPQTHGYTHTQTHWHTEKASAFCHNPFTLSSAKSFDPSHTPPLSFRARSDSSSTALINTAGEECEHFWSFQPLQRRRGWGRSREWWGRAKKRENSGRLPSSIFQIQELKFRTVLCFMWKYK